MYIFINEVDQTSNIIDKSISIRDELQERINSCTFRCFGFVPEDYQSVDAYSAYEVVSATADSATLDKDYNEQLQNNLYRVGHVIKIAIKEDNEEEATIESISSDDGNIKLTFTENFTNTPSTGELVGVKVFGGVISSVKNYNIRTLKNLEYSITALDHQKIFDKTSVNETYESRDARYIVNDFCNSTVNLNEAIDEFEYEDNAAIQTAWTESSDGDNPTTDNSDFREGDYSGNFPWTNSSGTANFSLNSLNLNLKNFSGTSSGAATKGVLGMWIKATDYTAITNIEIRIGSDSGDYISETINPENNDWNFYDFKLKNFSVTGTPDWTAIDYCEVAITQTSSSDILIDGLRILEEEFFKHFPYIEESIVFDNFTAPRTKPTEVAQRLADELGWYWYVDYDRSIRLFAKEDISAPFRLSETSKNFANLAITYDASRLTNRQVVEGGDETSVSTYSEVREGDGIIREWLTKNKFKNLVVKADKNTSTDTMEAGTTTTNIKATSHGLVDGDHIVNRSRSNAVRQIVKVDDDNFTVDAVASQASGDTFSRFIEQDVGVEGINDDSGNNFMSNFNEKSLRNASDEATLTAGQFVLFKYNEVVPILISRSDASSITNMVSVLGYSDGTFDGQKIVDKTLVTRSEAVAVAEAQINKYSNVIISATFTTTQEGLVSGQTIQIKDTENGTRNINQQFLIQKVNLKQAGWGENIYTVTCSSLLFGMMELLQQLLKQGRRIEVAEDEVVNNITGIVETLKIVDIILLNNNLLQISEILSIAENVTYSVVEPPFQWGPGGTNPGRWNLFSW